MKRKVWAAVMLILYAALLVKLMILKEMPNLNLGFMRLRFGGTHEGPANYIPFKSIWSYVKGGKGLVIGSINIIGNIVLLIPIGFLFPFVIRNLNLKLSLVLAVACGLAIECTQAILQIGIFDIDDVILNGLGIMLGYWIYGYWQKIRSRKKKNYSRT